jgi:DNA-binding transcriptional LysR family regulator
MDAAFGILDNIRAMKWKIDDVPVFVAVIERNGITAAADLLGMPKSSVSNALARLERALGLRLIERDSRNLRITAEGEVFYRKALAIVEQATEADAAMAGLTALPSGRLSVALPPAFSQEIFAPHLAGFVRAYPGIELDITVSSQGVALLRDQVDVAVAVGPLEDSELVSVVLVSGPLIWVASPGYAASLPDMIEERAIPSHVVLCEKRYGLARLPVHIAGRAATIDLAQGVSHVNDPLVVRRAVMHGAGVSVLPRHYCREQLADGSLVEVWSPVTFDRAASQLSAIYPSRRLLSPRVRVFVTHLKTICAPL